MNLRREMFIILLILSIISPLLAGVEGLRISIQTNKKIYLLEEPIECRFVFRNNGTQYIEIQNASENPVPEILKLIILDRTGRMVEYNHLSFSRFQPPASDFYKYYAKLGPGDSLVKYSLINDPFGVVGCSALREHPGVYKIAVKYYDDWKNETAYSDTITIGIKKPDTHLDAAALELYLKARRDTGLYLKIANDYPNSYYAPYALYLYTCISMSDAYIAERLPLTIAIERAKEYINHYPDFAQNVTLGEIFFLKLHRCYEKIYCNEAYRSYLEGLQKKNPNTILYQAIERTKEFFQRLKRYYKDEVIHSPW